MDYDRTAPKKVSTFPRVYRSTRSMSLKVPNRSTISTEEKFEPYATRRSSNGQLRVSRMLRIRDEDITASMQSALR